MEKEEGNNMEVKVANISCELSKVKVTSTSTMTTDSSSSLSSSSQSQSKSEETVEVEVKVKLYKRQVEREPLLKIPGEMYIDPLKRKVHMAKMAVEMEKQKANAELSRLVAQTGMPITQENGQRRYGPPRDYTGPPPRKGCEVFVGKIPRDAYEPELVPLFSKIGRIFEMRIMMDFTGLNRGYGFVQYYNSLDADNAIAYLNNYEIRPGKPIGVVKSVDNCRLYVGGIPKDKTRDQIFTEMNRITEGVERVLIYNDPVDRTMHRGFAFIEYDSHKAAAMARRKMLPGKISMWGVDVTVDWAQPEPDVLTIFVKNLAERTTVEKLEALFNFHSGNGVLRVIKQDNTAYINFDTPMQAEQARRILDGSVIDDSKINTSFAKQRSNGKNFIPWQMDHFQNQNNNYQQQNSTPFPNYQHERYHALASSSIPNQNQDFNTGNGNGSGNGYGYFSGPPQMVTLGGFGQYQNYNMGVEPPLQQLPTYFTPSRCNGNPTPGFYFQ